MRADDLRTRALRWIFAAGVVVILLIRVRSGTPQAGQVAGKDQGDRSLCYGRLSPARLGTTGLSILCFATRGKDRAAELRTWTEAELRALGPAAEAEADRFLFADL